MIEKTAQLLQSLLPFYSKVTLPFMISATQLSALKFVRLMSRPAPNLLPAGLTA